MKRIRPWATLMLVIFMTACSSGAGPGPGGAPSSPPSTPSSPSSPPSTPSSPSSPPSTPPGQSPQAMPPTPGAPALTPVPPVSAPPVAGAPPAAGMGAAPAPKVSLQRAFALVRQTAEAQQVIQRLGTRTSMVIMRPPADTFEIGVGENFPDRVRFELYFTVSRADGTVRYKDVMTGVEKPATPIVPACDPMAVQAEAMLGRGETQAAVDLLTKAAAAQPAADTWNLLSYAHLISGRWQAAADAGQKALELEAFHPYALYNTGMAEVELKQYPGAIYHLWNAVAVQPQRAEPYVGLSRAYQETGRYALAADAAAVALHLAPGDANAMQRQTAVNGMLSQSAPADLTAAATVRLEDGAYAIYLYPGKGDGAQNPAVVYLKGPEGVVGLPAGRLQPESWSAITRVDLPGGAVGYFLAGEPVGAHVAGSLAWRLFIRGAGGQLRQVVFVGESESFDPFVEDFLRSGGKPSVQGDRLVATYGDDASGKTTVQVTWQLVPGEAKAIQVESKRENRDPNK